MAKEKYIEFDLQSVLTPLSIIMAGAIIAGGIYFGLQGKDFNLGSDDDTQQVVANNENGDDTVPTPTPTEVTVSIDDDAYIGNKDTAKVAVVEFSDFDCPFCVKFYDETLGSLKDNFTSSGDVIFVYRDLPLPQLHAHAENKAQGAECAGEQGGS